MASPAANVDFDRNRIGQGELIAGISGLVLLISLWFKWYGIKVAGASGILRGFEPSANAWQSFGLIDIILFLVALIAIGAAVMRGLNRMPDMPYPPATIVTIAGGLALLLILFRVLVTPFDVPNGVDVTRKIGLFLGLLSAAGVAYGGWRAMQDAGTSFGDLRAGAGPGGGATTTAMPAGGVASPTPPPPAGGGAAEPGGSPGVPGGGASGVGEGKSGPGAPPPGTSTGGPDGEETPPAASAPDPVPGTTAPQTPPGIAGEPPREGGTSAPGI